MCAKSKSREHTAFESIITIIKAVAIGLAVSAALLLLFSFIMSKKDVPFMLLNPFSAGLLMVASMLSGYLAARKIRQKGMFIGSMCGIIIFLIVITASFMNSFNVGAAALIKLAISAVSGAIGGIMGVNAQLKRK